MNLAQMNKIYVVFEQEQWDGIWPRYYFKNENKAKDKVIKLNRNNKHVMFYYKELELED